MVGKLDEVVWPNVVELLVVNLPLSVPVNRVVSGIR